MKKDGPPPSAAAAEPAKGDGAAAEAAEDTLLDQLRGDLEAAKDRVLRSQAELENYRKRAAREIEEHRRYANLPLMHDLLPVLDNIERAIAAAEKTQDVAVLLEGVKLVARQFEETFARTIACGSAPCICHSTRTCTTRFRSSPPTNSRPTRWCWWPSLAFSCTTAWCGPAR